MKGGGSENGLHCFQLTFESLEGYANLLGRKIEKHVADAEYTLHSCLYNTASRQFIGRFHDTLPVRLVESLHSGAVICPIEQVAFFYSLHSEPSLILVTELTATYLAGGVQLRVGIGWSILPVFDRRGNQSKSSGPSSAVRLALYEGSPRALFTLPHPTADCKEMVPIPGCILTCSLCPHPILSKASHLIPSNVLVSYDDIIPGLVHTTVHQAFPKLLKTATSGSLEKVSLLLLPSVDAFEEHLLSALASDLGTADQASGGGAACDAVSIEERRLKVLQFNGWCFTASPAIGYLDRVLPSAKPSSSFRGSMHSLRSNLVLKGSLELAGLLAHPLLEVLLQLEYLVSWSRPAAAGAATAASASSGVPHSGSSRKSLQASTKQASASHTTAITLGWAVWQPFHSEGGPLEQESHTSLDLKLGPGFTPTVIPSTAHKTCYQGTLSDAGKINFRFIPLRVSSRADSSQFFNASGTSFYPEDSPRRSLGKDMPDSGTQPLPLPPDQPLPPSLLRKPTTASEQAGAEGGATELAPASLTPPAPAIDVRHGGVSTRRDHSSRDAMYVVSRSILAFFHDAGFEEFTDLRGNPLPLVTAPMDTPPSSLDALSEGPCQIAVQFLAFQPTSFAESGAACPSSPSSLLLTSYFHVFPPSTVSCALLAPTSREHSTAGAGGGGGAARPLIIQPAQGGERNGLTIRYAITPGTLPTREDRLGFTSHLTRGHLITDLYDRGSLLLLGTAHVPLQSLRSTKEEFHQSMLCVPVLLSSATTDCTVSTLSLQEDVSGCTETGQLYLRLARLPADTSTTTTLQQQQPGKPLPHQAQLAQRLYGGHTPWGEGPQGDEEEQARRRKHARMQSIRELKLKTDLPPQPSQLQQMQPSSRQTVIELQREELKRECISSVLRASITTSYQLRPRMGAVLYFEHEFRNVRNHPVTVSVTWKDAKLRMVTDRAECIHLRHKHSIHTVMDDHLITENCQEPGNPQQHGFFVHPGETVRLPFKYQSFQPTKPSSSSSSSCGPPNEKSLISVFLQTAQSELLAILNVEVDPLFQRTDRVFHFYHPEHTFLKRSFTLDELGPELGLAGGVLHGAAAEGVLDLVSREGELFACSSDPDNVCEIRKTEKGTAMVFVKAPVKQAPLVHSFYIILYRHKYLVSPLEVWQIIVHSVHRVDHSLILGQSSPLRLAVHGNHADRRVSCHSLSAPFVKVVSPSPFLLPAHSLTELQFSLKTLHSSPTSHHTAIVSAIDVDGRQLLDVWMVCVSATQPAVSRAFQISLPLGGDKCIEKSITFTNPYPRKKLFHLSTSHPSLLTFSSPSPKLRGGEASALELLFTPSAHPLSRELLVFINDDHDQTEECFLVRVLYE